MVRFIGGRFGNNVSAPGGGASPPSVYTSRDQWWMQKASSWPNYIETTGITASGGTNKICYALFHEGTTLVAS